MSICAVDTIGYPGKSAEVSLSARNYDYGKWAGEVIDALGYYIVMNHGFIYFLEYFIYIEFGNL